MRYFIFRQKLCLTGILVTLVIVSVFIFLRMPAFLVLEKDLQPAGAIVILLASTPERELEAADIYHQGYAPMILIVDFSTHSQRLLDSLKLRVPRGRETVISVLGQLDVPAESIHIIPGVVSSTQGEAVAVRNFLQTRTDIDTIILVSSPYHMRRATILFRRELKKLDHDVKVIPRPSSYSNFNTSKRWFRNRNTAILVITEYLKIIASPFDFRGE
jgi:uncharacterized SAM-binding protein YcdF (DUF218 family)